VKLRDVVNLHVAVELVLGFVVDSNSQSSVADQGVQTVELSCKFFGDFVCLVEIFQLDLNRVDFRSVTVLLETFLGLLDMLFLLS